MHRRQLSGFVCMMLLGSSCSAENMAASAAGATAEGNVAPSSAPGSEQGTLRDPAVRAKLRDLALHASSGAGVSSPRTMIAVASPDHQAAEEAVSGGSIVYDHAPVYVVVMTGGPFTGSEHPRGVSPPEGSVLTLTVDAASFRVTDYGIGNTDPDLSKIASASVDLAAE